MKKTQGKRYAQRADRHATKMALNAAQGLKGEELKAGNLREAYELKGATTLHGTFHVQRWIREPEGENFAR